nr:helix-turn-helix domain-containing protein [uncultured Desulfobacter sp.]
MKVKKIAVNEDGRRIGESHPMAKLTDCEVERLRQIREESGMTYRELAKKFGISYSSVQKICTYLRRAEWSVRYKLVPILTKNERKVKVYGRGKE